MSDPKWLEEIASYSKVSEYPPYTDTVAQLLAHIRELREALRLNVAPMDHPIDCGVPDCPVSIAIALLNRQEPPEVE